MNNLDHLPTAASAPAAPPPAAVPVEARTAGAAGWRQRLHRPFETVQFFFHRMMTEDDVFNTAAALCFSTALAVVPALALTFGILAAFPEFRSVRAQLQQFIMSSLVPDLGLKMSAQLSQFVEAASNLTLFGLGGLFVTSVLLLLTIEGAFNRIFRVAHPRPWLKRIAVLWATFILGPFMVAVTMMLLGYFATNADGQTDGIVLAHVLPTMLSWLTLTFLYRIVPHRPVSLTDACAGGALAALLLEALRVGFAYYVNNTTYGAIYGAVAAVPVFLLWVYGFWTAVMAGAVLTAALPDWRLLRAGLGSGPGQKLSIALAILDVLAERSGQRMGGVAPEEISHAISVPANGVLPILEELRAAEYVAVTKDALWVVSRDLFETPLIDLVHRFGMGVGPAVLELKGTALGARINPYLAPAAAAEIKLLGISLSDLLKRKAFGGSEGGGKASRGGKAAD